jgi:dynamin 1-like protein
LVKTTPREGQHAEWGEFLHLPGKRFHDFDRIRHEISAETERMLGSNKGVSDKPIRLKIHSPNVLTMTLVDLPGITRVPVGDQPADIEAKLRSLILNYISSPSCIILAVSPANQDLASSDALDLAKQADPEGVRTIGVLTKLDIMDRGTDAAAALRNEIVPLRLGYVGVVLRSQEDITQRRSMAEARESERVFFQSRSEYAAVANSCGVATLARVLNGILVCHIREALPTLRSRLEDAASSRRRELRMLGDAPPGSTGAARGALLLSILDSYAARFAAMLDGHGDHLPITELAGGARIRHIFLDIFSSGLDALDPTAELSDEDVRTAIKNSGGIKGSLLIPEAPFELLVRRAIERLLSPALQCKEFVHAELLRIAAQCVPPEVGRFPTLQTVLSEAVEDLVNSGASPAEHMIRNLVACELAYINTSHPQFIGGNRAIAEVLGRRGGSGSLSGDDDAVPAHRPKSASNHHSAIPKAHPVVTSSPNGLAAAAKMAARPTRPELFRPEELLIAKDNSSYDDNDAHKGWFSNWFARGGGAVDTSGNSGGNTSPSGENVLQRPAPTLKVPKAASDQEGVQVEVTRVLVDSYFDIVRKNLQDAVPKAVMNFLVGATRRSLQQHLIRSLYREDLLGELMAEREDVAVRRQHCQDSLRALRVAIKTLEALPGEMTGRVITNASGARWNFKHALQALEEAEQGGGKRGGSRSSSPLKSGLREGTTIERPRSGGSKAPMHKAAAAATRAGLSAVIMMGGGGSGGGGGHDGLSVS